MKTQNMKNQNVIKPLTLAISIAFTSPLIFNSALASPTQEQDQRKDLPMQQERLQITSANQIPNRMLKIETLPSELIFSGTDTLPELEGFLTEYVDMLEQGYDINDTTAKREFLETKLALRLAQQHWSEAIELIAQIRDLSEKAAAKQTTRLIPLAYAQAMLELGSADHERFQTVFEKHLNLAMEKVDLTVAGNDVKNLLGRRQLMTRNFLGGYAEANIDEPAKMAKLNLTVSAIQSILSFHRTVNDELPLRDVIIASLSAHLENAPQVITENRWLQRDIAIETGNTTLVAIWDTGIDTELQQGRMWNNPDVSAVNPHGLAFDEYFVKQSDNLLTRVNEYGDQLNELLALLKGFSDQRSNQSTQAAKDFQAHVSALKPEELGEFQNRLGDTGVYSHGQMVADVAAQGLSPVQLMNIKMSWQNMELYKENPIDENYVSKLVAAAQESVDFMRQHKVRVVNLSWRLSMPMFEEILLVTASESDPAKAKLRAEKLFNTLNDGLQTAFASAPEILFIAGAGNEDENVEFVKSTPAGINLPNVITVGAVDPGLKPTSFTSFGASIDLYANGYEVPARMPGGMMNKASGTSIAAPLVTNLAAKILAKQPELSPPQVIALMQKHATLESEQQLPVVHPLATICAVASELSQCAGGKVAKVQ